MCIIYLKNMFEFCIDRLRIYVCYEKSVYDHYIIIINGQTFSFEMQNTGKTIIINNIKC